MSNLYEEIAKGKTSEAALAELSDKFDIMEQNLHIMWANSTAANKEGREEAYYQLNALKQLRKSFEIDIRDGKFAEDQLKLENDKNKH